MLHLSTPWIGHGKLGHLDMVPEVGSLMNVKLMNVRLFYVCYKPSIRFIKSLPHTPRAPLPTGKALQPSLTTATNFKNTVTLTTWQILDLGTYNSWGDQVLTSRQG